MPNDGEVDQILGTLKNPPLDMREFVALDKALQRTWGELVNNLAKLSKLDEHNLLKKRKLDEAEDEFSHKKDCTEIT